MNDETLRYKLLRPVRRRVAARYRESRDLLSAYATLVERELTVGRSLDVPWRRRVRLWRRGFTSRSDVLFDLDDDYGAFVSDLQHELTDGVTEPWDAVVNNKLTYYLLFSSFSRFLPGLYGVVDDGEVKRTAPSMESLSQSVDGAVSVDTDRPGSFERAEAVPWIDAYLDANEALVLKPIYGQGGGGVLVCRKPAGADGYVVNGERTGSGEFAAAVGDLEGYLAWEFAEQAEYAAELFPESTNTLRILTMWDYDADEPFVAGAVHRVGTERSAPVDNWSQGGLSAEVVEDGVLGDAAQWLPSEGVVRRYGTHPDTGTTIEGARVPDWPRIRRLVLEIAAEFPSLPRLGWDVVHTGDGEFDVLEVNAHAATRTFQVHRPLLCDPRVRRFYRHHGCL
ncbi:sugar-transfer associated ATP-grasp domain-containing protein [Halobium palmae]|uniref:Sugar-transfer associated ATP-grasp domain-containing protein n=1 Tax=Halobium palmae TaxID=1776492 RepID=A0ABD5RXG9_9EURY